MTEYDVTWTDTITHDQRVTTVWLMNQGTADLFVPIIAAANFAGVRDEGRVHVDSYVVTGVTT